MTDQTLPSDPAPVRLAPGAIQLAPDDGVRFAVIPPAVPLGPLPDPKQFLLPDVQALVQRGYRF